MRAPRHAGRTVLLSSHILGEVEKLCDTVTIIRAGRFRGPRRRPRSGARPRSRALRYRQPSDVRGAGERQPAHPAHAAPKSGTAFTGTGGLIRLNPHRDRIRIAIWTLAVGIGVYGSVVALDKAFPTPESLQARGALLTNPATLMMTGPAFAADHYTFGTMVANELSLYVFRTVAITAILHTVRHTRAEEESGRLERLRALPIGRFAPPAVALATVGLAAVLVGAVTTVGLVATGHEDLDVDSPLALDAGTALTGLVFAALASVTAQLTEYARGATGHGTGHGRARRGVPGTQHG